MILNKKNKVSDILKNMGIDNRYFQPPESLKLNIPCVIYEFDNMSNKKADNNNYLVNSYYKVSYVTKDYSDETVGKFLDNGFSFRTEFIKDGLYHFVFYIYV